MKKHLCIILLFLYPIFIFSQNVEVEGSIKIIDGTQGADKILTSDTAGLASWQFLPSLPTLDNVVWVAINGTPTGPGTIDRPFSTVQSGYDAAAAIYSGQPSTVVIAAGVYGSLNMHAGTVHVLGLSRPELAELQVTYGFPMDSLFGKQNVENITIAGPTWIKPNGLGAWVKFHNCRFLDGLLVEESYVEIQDCAIQRGDLASPALSIGTGAAAITRIGIYQSSIFSVDTSTAPGTVPGTVMLLPLVMDFEMIGCQVANEGPSIVSGATGPAIRDLSPPIAPPGPLHLYSHNMIKGPPTGTGNPAVADSQIGIPPPLGPTIVFTHNIVYGDVGGAGGVALPSGAPQFFANNTIYGIINFPALGPSVVGWVQAGAGLIPDGAGNTEHPIAWGLGGFTLPSNWKN